jgi:hypothetical protein
MGLFACLPRYTSVNDWDAYFASPGLPSYVLSGISLLFGRSWKRSIRVHMRLTGQVTVPVSSTGGQASGGS